VVLTTIGQLAAAALLAVQAFAGTGSFWLLLCLVVAQEACGALGGPASRTFTVRLLPEHLLGAGIALRLVTFQLSLLAGPALAGLVTSQWGAGGCYLADTAGFCVALYCVLRLPAMRPLGETTRPGIRGMVAGWRFIVHRTTLRGAFLTDLLATVMAMPIALFPVLNAERFGGNPETLGLFLTAIGVGGIVASMASGFVTRATRPGPVMLAAVAAWGLGLAAFGFVESLWLTLGFLAVAGAADVVSVTSRGTIVQLATPDSYRGRISAVERIIGKSGPELGNFRAGIVAEATSASFAALSGGLVCAAGAAVLAVTNKPLHRFRVPDPAGQAATSVSSAE
ncbi:MAG: MFS transporter, partial [Nocardioidaceae bacterium]